MKLTQDEMKAAVEWFKDCLWADYEESDFDELTEAQIERGIRRHFAGGIEAFKAACQGA